MYETNHTLASQEMGNSYADSVASSWRRWRPVVSLNHERIQYCHSQPYHLIWHHAFVSLSSCCAGPRWYQGGHQVSSSFELSSHDMDPSLMMMRQFYHVRWLNQDQFSSQPSCNSSVDIIEVKCRIPCQSSYDMMIAQPSELLTFQWGIFINWINCFDNGPCQKGRVMMISIAFFQASCAWSAMAISVMICVLKKSSCSLIDERLGVAFGKMYSISLWCLCQLHKLTNDCASMLGIVRGVFCSYGGQMDTDLLNMAM